MSRVQSAIAEKSTPLLMDATLLNSFFERKIYFEQNLPYKDHHLAKTYDLYQSINEHMLHWSTYYNTLSNDSTHNKKLVLHHINNEFNNNKHKEMYLLYFDNIIDTEKINNESRKIVQKKNSY